MAARQLAACGMFVTLGARLGRYRRHPGVKQALGGATPGRYERRADETNGSGSRSETAILTIAVVLVVGGDLISARIANRGMFSRKQLAEKASLKLRASLVVAAC